MHPMTIGEMDAICWECIYALAVFNWSVVTYYESPVPKGLTHFQHVYKL